MRERLEALLNLPIVQLLRDTFNEWNADKAPRLAAALAYYTAFSIAPLLLVVIAVAGLFFNREAVQGQIDNQIQGLVGTQTADTIQEIVASANRPSAGIFATIVGTVTLVLGAAGVFGQVQDALNTIWGVAPKPTEGIRGMLRSRVLSFAMILIIGFLLLVSLVLTTVLASLNGFMARYLPVSEGVLQLINQVISFGVITLLFALIYKFLPDAKIGWRDVWVGAAVTALLFTIGKFVLGLYLGNSGVASSYGAAGAFIVLLLWIYYSAQILLFGAEFTQVYAKRYGSNIQPSSHAILVNPNKASAQNATAAQKAQAEAHHEEQPDQLARKAVAAASSKSAPAVPLNNKDHIPASPAAKRLDRAALAVMAGLSAVVVGLAVRGDRTIKPK